MEYERKTQIQNKLHQNRVNSIWNKLENQQKLLRNIYNTAQSTQEDITQIHNRIVNARKLISDLYQKYSHYLKESCVTTTLHKLKDTVKLATSKLEEYEVVDDKTHPNTTCQLKDYRELTQDLLGENNQELNRTILNPKLHENLATMGCIEASESENTNQDTIGDNAHKQEGDRNNQDSEKDSIHN